MICILLKVLLLIITTKQSTCTVDSITYMDPLNLKPKEIPGSDPCNPLYWYPRHIPDYCYQPKLNLVSIPSPFPQPIPVPLPVIFPPHLPPAWPAPIPPLSIGPPPSRSIPSILPPPIPISPPAYPSPFAPHNSPGFPYRPFPPFPQTQVGLVPGIPGIVSPNGGINILPFSDAYSDLLEKNKSKMLNKRIQKILEDYEDYPRLKRHRKWRRLRKRIRDYEY